MPIEPHSSRQTRNDQRAHCNHRRRPLVKHAAHQFKKLSKGRARLWGTYSSHLARKNTEEYSLSNTEELTTNENQMRTMPMQLGVPTILSPQTPTQRTSEPEHGAHSRHFLDNSDNLSSSLRFEMPHMSTELPSPISDLTYSDTTVTNSSFNSLDNSLDTNEYGFDYSASQRTDHAENAEGSSWGFSASERPKSPINVQKEEVAESSEDSGWWPLSYRASNNLRMPPPTATALQVATRLIKYARSNNTLDTRSSCCSDCGVLPIHPVTGGCGHTRCYKCIVDYGECACGAQPPQDLHVNTIAQEIGDRIIPIETCKSSSRAAYGLREQQADVKYANLSVTQALLGKSKRRAPLWRKKSSLCLTTMPRDMPATMPMTPQGRFEVAVELLRSGQLWAAAPHLARVASSGHREGRARILLAQIIRVLSNGRDERCVLRGLCRAVRAQSARHCVSREDLKCSLCCHTLTRPVTTPCGHTYCRTCLERSLDYRKTCALCMRSLRNFNVNNTVECEFINAALASIGALSPPIRPDPNVIPIFACTVAFPNIPCPLFIFDPRYWVMIRRVLQSESRIFGMVANERDGTYSEYGTVLKVCDCVHLEDGRYILSTIGVSRFVILETDEIDGCDVARIQPVVDVIPTDDTSINTLRIAAVEVAWKSVEWLNCMSLPLRREVEATFGRLPLVDPSWWTSPDGPSWLWWFIAILPLKPEIKVLILSTKSLRKRMMAVIRTLDTLEESEPHNPECAVVGALDAEQ